MSAGGVAVAAAVAVGLTLALTRKKKPASAAAVPPGEPPVPVPEPAPPPNPSPPQVEPPTTIARIWFPLYRTRKIPLYTERELLGWFQGPRENAAIVDEALALDTTKPGITFWSLEEGLLTRPDLTGMTAYITYRTTTELLPVPGTVRRQLGATWTTGDYDDSILDSLDADGASWELRAWLGPV